MINPANCILALSIALSSALSSAHAECLDEVLLDGMTLCLLTDRAAPEARERVVDILNGHNLLSAEQRSNFKQAFSECVRQDPRQTENFEVCQTFDPRIPLNMGRSILGQPAVSSLR